MKKVLSFLVIVTGICIISVIGSSCKNSNNSNKQDSLLMANLDEINEDVEEKDTESLKNAYKCILDKYSSDNEYEQFGTYFLFDITGDDIPELWIFAQTREEGNHPNFQIYTIKGKEAFSIYSDEYDPMGTTFKLGEKGVYERYYTQGHEEINVFRYKNGKIVTEEVYSLSVNPENWDETVEKGVEPKCKEIKTFKISDRKPLNMNEIPKIQTIKEYSDYVGTWKLNRIEAGQKIRIEIKLNENQSGEFVVFHLTGSRDEVLVFEQYPQCVFTDGVIYLTKNGDITRGDVPKLKATSDGLYSFDNEKYVKK